jgi:hypothetical protein
MWLLLLLVYQYYFLSDIYDGSFLLSHGSSERNAFQPHDV